MGVCCHTPRTEGARGGEDPPLWASEGTWPPNSLISDLQLPDFCSELPSLWSPHPPFGSLRYGTLPLQKTCVKVVAVFANEEKSEDDFRFHDKGPKGKWHSVFAVQRALVEVVCAGSRGSGPVQFLSLPEASSASGPQGFPLCHALGLILFWASASKMCVR